MRPRRLELPYLSALAPQASVSTSSTKAAYLVTSWDIIRLTSILTKKPAKASENAITYHRYYGILEKKCQALITMTLYTDFMLK